MTNGSQRGPNDLLPFIAKVGTGHKGAKDLSYEEAVRSLAAFSPQRRLIEPDEVAAVAVHLASDDARGVTGQAWNVDGGAVQA